MEHEQQNHHFISVRFLKHLFFSQTLRADGVFFVGNPSIALVLQNHSVITRNYISIPIEISIWNMVLSYCF